MSKYIYIGADFSADDFRYVPFNPPVLDPTALASGRYLDSNKYTLLNISLDKETTTGVKFKYCFDLKDSSETAPGTASIQDFNETDSAKVYLCSLNQSGEVEIATGGKDPVTGTEVYLNILKDYMKEGTELLPFKVFDMYGAVMPGNKKEGYFYISIEDLHNKPLFEKDTLKPIPENSPNLTPIDTLFAKHDDERCQSCTFTLVNPSDYIILTEDGAVLVKDSTKFNFEERDSISFRVHVMDSDSMWSDTTIVVWILDVNERPSLKDTALVVFENNKIGEEIGTLVSTDPDTKNPEFSERYFEAVGGDTDVFSVDSLGRVTVKKSLDYENDSSTYTLIVRVVDRGGLADTAMVTIYLKDSMENSVVDIIVVDDSVKKWYNPNDTIFTHNPGREYCWTQDGDTLCADTTFKEGPNIIKKFYQDSTRN